MRDNAEITAEAGTRLRDIAAKLAMRIDTLTVADLFFEAAVAVALDAIPPSELARVFRLRADDIEALGDSAAFDA